MEQAILILLILELDLQLDLELPILSTLRKDILLQSRNTTFLLSTPLEDENNTAGMKNTS